MLLFLLGPAGRAAPRSSPSRSRNRAGPGCRGGLVRAEVTDVVDAIALMTEIGATLPVGDGVASFNRMYLTVTTAVYDAIGNGFFTNSAFLERLDIVFANRYFSARPGRVGSWRAALLGRPVAAPQLAGSHPVCRRMPPGPS